MGGRGGVVSWGLWWEAAEPGRGKLLFAFVQNIAVTCKVFFFFFGGRLG